MTEPTEQARPTPDGSARAGVQPISSERSSDSEQPDPAPSPAPVDRGQLTAIEIQPSQVVAAAGTAIVTAARVGRLLGRSGWRVARQLPGARAVEREAQRLQNVAVTEARRLLQAPQSAAAAVRPTSSPEHQAAAYIRNADPGTAPLRNAMGELLERSVEATRTDSRDYLYGSIISQLVPDEARILAALADGTHFATTDVVQKLRRGKPRVLLANASSVGRQAGLVSPDNVPTYLTRLHGFGLVEFGPEDDSLDVQYDILATDATIEHARESVESRRRGSVKLVRRTLGMSSFGREFWAASDPSRPALPSR